MKRVLSCFLIFALLGCSVLAFASCSIKFTSPKATDATTVPADTEAQPTESAETTAPETTVPTEDEITVGEDPEQGWSPVHPLN